MCLSVDVSEQNTAAQVIQDQNWKETKQFRDPVYGYIQVPVPYVRYLIDTSYMQRIKGIAQSGLRPLFAAATHDRFAHSIGVYRFAMLLYDSFCKSALDALKRTKNFTNEEMKPFEDELLEWKNLLAIASILHDIGHPIQSHAMEFLYDDVFLKFPDEGEDLPLKISTQTSWIVRGDNISWSVSKRYPMNTPHLQRLWQRKRGCSTAFSARTLDIRSRRMTTIIKGILMSV